MYNNLYFTLIQPIDTYTLHNKCIDTGHSIAHLGW